MPHGMNTVDFDSDSRGKICLSPTFCAIRAKFVLTLHFPTPSSLFFHPFILNASILNASYLQDKCLLLSIQFLLIYSTAVHRLKVGC